MASDQETTVESSSQSPPLRASEADTRCIEGSSARSVSLLDVIEGEKFSHEEVDQKLTQENALAAVEAAVSGGQVQLVEYIVDHYDVNLKDSLFLHIAAREGQVEALEMGIDKYNLDPAKLDPEGRTPLHQACRNGRLQIVKVLIEKYKATPDETKSNSGMTALHIAAEGGHVDIVKYFVEECKIQGDIPDVNGYTPEQYAAKNGHRETVRYLKESFGKKEGDVETSGNAVVPDKLHENRRHPRPPLEALFPVNEGQQTEGDKQQPVPSAKKSFDVCDIHVESERTILEGELEKEGYYVKSWKTRRFQLTPSRLLYYDNEGQCRGEISLVDIENIEPQDEKGLFYLYTCKDRTYKLRTANNRSRAKWIAAINSARKEPSKVAKLSREVSRLFHSGKITESQYHSINEDIASCEDEDKLNKNDIRLQLIDNGVSDPGPRSKELHDSIRTFKEAKDTKSLISACKALTHCCEKDKEISRNTKEEIVSEILEKNKMYMKEGDHPDSIPVEVTTAYQNLFEKLNCPEDTGEVRPGSRTVHRESQDRDRDTVESAADKNRDDDEPSEVRNSLLQSLQTNDLSDIVTPGSLKDRFKIQEHLGTGGYSSVYCASDIKTGERVAVKFVKKAGLEDNIKNGFFREVKVMKRLDHPNIVTFRAFFDEKEHYVLVTELVKGGELFDQIVRKRSYKESEARDVVKTVADAICYMHERGIVHRDLKPENILIDDVTKTQSIKIADMGFATVVPKKLLDTPCGSPSYVAPEVLKGRAYGEQVDCWSLGVVTFVLLCGYGPFQDRHPKNQYSKIQQGLYYFDSPYWDNVSNAAKDFIRRLLVVDPSQRMTAAEMLEHEWVTKTLGHDDLSNAKERMAELEAEKRRIRFKGLLEKRGRFNKDWKQRMFTLTEEYLLYADPKTKEVKRKIPLREIKKAKKLDDECMFEVSTDGGRSFIMKASTLEERDDWVRTINRTIESHLLHRKAENAMEYVEKTSVRQGTEVVGLMKDVLRFQRTDEKIRESLYNDGLAYEEGKGVHQDLSLAADNYDRAARSGHTESQYRLGMLYEKGIGVKKNESEAIRLFEEAAEAGHLDSIYRLGQMFYNKKTSSSCKRAAKYFGTASDRDHAASIRALAHLHYYGLGVEKDLEKGFNLLNRAARNGDPVAQWDLAMMFLSGESVKKNIQQAIYWFKALDEQGNVDAQYKLSKIFAEEFVDDNDANKKSEEWFNKAVRNRHPVALHDLGKQYEMGINRECDLAEAFKWYKSAADSGLAKAQYKVGLMLAEGTGVEVDKEAAAKYLRAASKEFAHAVHVAERIQNEDDFSSTSVDDLESSVVNSNDTKALLEAGKMNLPHNLKNAVWYLSLAAAKGNEEALQELEKLDTGIEEVSGD